MTPCPDCEPHGWRTVQEPYAAAEARKRGEPGTHAYQAALETFRTAVYPCRTCNLAMFVLWAGGHLDSGHDREACATCDSAKASGGGAVRRRAGRHEEPPPPDEEPPPHVPDFASRAAGER